MRGVKYLILRGETYWYSRRVPKELNKLLPNKFVNHSLKTKDFNEAVGIIPEINKQTEDYFKTVELNGVNDSDQEKYQKAIRRAAKFGFVYQDAATLSEGPLPELQTRLEVAEKHIDNPAVVEAVLGGAVEPELKLSNLFELFYEISKGVLRNKSHLQLRHWKTVRINAIDNFISVVKDKRLVDLNRKDGLAFRDYWMKRLAAENKAANTANKQFGFLQNMIRTVLEHYQLDFVPIFSGLRFTEALKLPRIRFETEFIISKLLPPDALPNLGEAGIALIHLMSDTGVRPSELIGIDDNEIFLDHAIPYIHIKPNAHRDLKTLNSEREMPLIGYSLAAAQRGAFEKIKRYRTMPDNLTTMIGMYFKRNKILPSKQTSLYSLRHSFSDRLLDAEVPEKMHDYLMGHDRGSVSYGFGPELAKRKKWLEKAALPSL